MEAWNTFFAKEKIIFEELKNAPCKELLRQIKRRFYTEEMENERNVIFSLALHGLFPPSLMSLKNGQGHKPSIIESQDSFLQLTTDELIGSAVEKRREMCLKMSIPEHPLVFGISELNAGIASYNKKKMYNKSIYDIRDVKNIKTFRVVYGPVNYETENFLNAVNFCFKIYKTFTVPYPECSKMWCFLDHVFYGITDETTSKIASLLNNLK